MPNHDFNRPCDCKECRTVYDNIICPECGFKNTVSIECSVEGYSYDKKGLGGYDFIEPTEPVKDLTCYKCGFLIKKVRYFTNIAERFCKTEFEREVAINEGKLCFVCGKVEGFDYSNFECVKLQNLNDKMYCQTCFANLIKKQTPDPSNDNEKYMFDNKKLKWVLTKVKKACTRCGIKRWLNIENQWKAECISCYRRKISNKA